MQYKEKEIKKGIQLHEIQTEKFKTNLIAIFLTTPITRENVTKDALVSTVLRRGSKNMPTLAQISKEMEEMYGASFDCGIDKTGDNHVLKFYIEAINDKFIAQKDENMLKTAIEKLLEIVFNPLTENDVFKEEYVAQEKENIKRIINGRADNKARYAFDRCVEEMYKEKPYGLYKYGYIEDLDKITTKSLYEYYQKLISECKIDIFVSGDIEQVNQIIENNEEIKKLPERDAIYVVNKIEDKESAKENEVIEEMDVTQGKITIGLDLHLENVNQMYSAIIYNAILGGTANSKMFQEVREKASLAYSAGSSYVRYKSNIFIKCGIEIKTTLEEYMERINEVTREDIIKIAKSITINTVYFLKNK